MALVRDELGHKSLSTW